MIPIDIAPKISWENMPDVKTDFTGEFALIAEHMHESVRQYMVDAGRGDWPHRKDGGLPQFSGGPLEGSLTEASGTTWAELSSALPYSAIHQFGGEIFQVVSDKQRSFFWSKFYETGDEKWKGMALSRSLLIAIPARPYMVFQPEDVDFILNKLSGAIFTARLNPA